MAALNGGNKLMRNNGDGTFTNVSNETGMEGAFNSSRGWSSTVVDMNQDLLPEVLWVGDFHRSHYFKNTGTGGSMIWLVRMEQTRIRTAWVALSWTPTSMEFSTGS